MSTASSRLAMSHPQRKAPLRRRAGLMYRATTSAEQARSMQWAPGQRRHRDGLGAYTADQGRREPDRTRKTPLEAGAEVVALTSAARPTDTISHGAMAAVWRP